MLCIGPDPPFHIPIIGEEEAFRDMKDGIFIQPNKMLISSVMLTTKQSQSVSGFSLHLGMYQLYTRQNHSANYECLFGCVKGLTY